MKVGKWLARFQVRLRTGCHLTTCNFHTQAVVTCNQNCLSVLRLSEHVEGSVRGTSAACNRNCLSVPHLLQIAGSFHPRMRRTCAKNVQMFTCIGLLSLGCCQQGAATCVIVQGFKPLWCFSSNNIQGSGNKRCTVAAWIICSFWRHQKLFFLILAQACEY